MRANRGNVTGDAVITDNRGSHKGDAFAKPSAQPARTLGTWSPPSVGAYTAKECVNYFKKG
jgi:hypothetical protein